ncbi:MAG: hypothetical protein II943_00510 [Victivallales bacterium]|nr:hypothetical protein [Victivallales bacterium]
MTGQSGWVKIWRGMRESCVRRRRGLEFCGAMVWLILEAAYRGCDDPLFGRLEPGDVAVSLRRLAAEWGMSLKQARTVVDALTESGFMVPARVSRRWGTVYRIVNYARYQGVASPCADDVPEAAADGEECPGTQVGTESVTQYGTLANGLPRIGNGEKYGETGTLVGTQHGTQAGTLAVCARTRVLQGIPKKEEFLKEEKREKEEIRPSVRPSAASAQGGAPESPQCPSAGGISFDWDGDCQFHGEKLAMAVELWRGAYPALDVDAELRKARTWLADNASQGAFREDIRLWLSHWMQKAERLRRASETRAAGRAALGAVSPAAAELDYESVPEDAAFMEL